MRKLSPKIEMKGFAGSFSSNSVREEREGRQDDRRMKSGREGKGPEDEYKDLVYSLLSLCYSVVAGTGQDKSKD